MGRCLILTGARQTGKTTLLQKEFGSEYEYYSFDDPLERDQLLKRGASDWITRGRSSIFDEVQKAPAFLGTVKAVLDQGRPDQRLILSGSAQIGLLGSVRETLAGRSVTRELFPLTAAEIAGVERPALVDLVQCRNAADVEKIVRELAMAADAAAASARARAAFDHVAAWGGMPALMDLDQAEHRWIWLQEYCRTYLQRDLADLGRVSDLDDFVRLERVAAARTASPVNYADMARDADLAPVTAKKFLRYLELSYQAFMLAAFRGTSRTRLGKAAKLHWTDVGVLRVLARARGALSGSQTETLVIAETAKLAWTLQADVEPSHLRTKDGREIDLVLRLPAGNFVVFEVKAGDRASRVDARHLRGLRDLLGGPVLAGFVLHQGRAIETLERNLYAVPAADLLARSL